MIEINKLNILISITMNIMRGDLTTEIRKKGVCFVNYLFADLSCCNQTRGELHTEFCFSKFFCI